MHPTPTQLDDDPAAIKQRRDTLNALIRANYWRLCPSTLAVVHKRCRGMKEQEKIELAHYANHPHF
ncbi:MAG TPA: hypothetical protein VFE47_13445 [Tepidisphaeraceae bacterium]|jgi:hypothetical protein|nr:hypothetical protein [Tepidisphaeraceae bacterium]